MIARVEQLLSAAAGFSGAERERLLDLAVLEAMPLALAVARRYGGADSREDVQQVAALALVRAVRGYRPEDGPAFAAYALPTIHGDLKRHRRDHGWALRPPRRVQELYWAARTPHQELTQDLCREPTSGEIARHLDVDEQEVREVATAAGGLVAASLEGLQADRPDAVRELTTDEPGFERLIGWQSVLPSLDALPSRSRQILAMHFFGGLQQTRIGAELGISQAMVSRELAAALLQVRVAMAGSETGLEGEGPG